MDVDSTGGDDETRSITLLTGRAPSSFDENEGPHFNAQRSRMFLRFIEARDGMRGHTAEHAMGAPRTPAPAITTINAHTLSSTSTPVYHYKTPTSELDKPVPPTAHERVNASKRKAQFAIVNGELLDRTAAATLPALAVAGVNNHADVAGGTGLINGSSTPKKCTRSATYRADPFIDDEPRANTPSAGRAPSIFVDDMQELAPEHHARDKSEIARPLEAASLGAAYRVDPLAPGTGANTAVQPTPVVLRNPIATVPPIPHMNAQSNVATRAHASGNSKKANDLKKLKSPPKQRVDAIPSTANTTPASRSARAVSNAPSVGTVDHPIDVDAPTEEELQAQAEEWAALVLSFAKSKNTRVRDHRPLVGALNDASVACLSARVLVDSGLYAAMRALSGLDVAGEMFGAVNMAKRLADRWERQFGDALNEDA
ncbi:hypothetical protein PENSPDRAFT_659511 [Peniophora sp. CONT]|nr:hypothetical protein PENSPDRAFT_659511 [Peniophora sp. CONT]